MAGWEKSRGYRFKLLFGFIRARAETGFTDGRAAGESIGNRLRQPRLAAG
ncbi:hypothetical protein [Mesorhizobium sp. M0276]